jgi:two-component system OmpR family response regulator
VILYVEDEAIVALNITMALEEEGYVVEHVLSGNAALKAVEDRIADFTALLTDVRLPEVDGWSIARRARELNPEIPVTYISGDSAIDWRAQGVPGSIMIQKPCSTDDVIATVASMLKRPSPVSLVDQETSAGG